MAPGFGSVALTKRLNIQRRLAWSLCRDDTHNRREATLFFSPNPWAQSLDTQGLTSFTACFAGEDISDISFLFRHIPDARAYLYYYIRNETCSGSGLVVTLVRPLHRYYPYA